eukprot:TRINITY_DN8568_c1_g1_i1.p1 TRINITY_DN8568_c1_g1~~TRINITY_DN8568_c1_g1_i1.p1  ORF type:complete len:289 (+),score=39.93 TRINITY_DN8568_c1_g1_i1:41-907(+)
MDALVGFVAVNGAFSLASDLVAQRIEGDEQGIDWNRAGTFTATGIGFQGMTQFVRHYAVDVMFEEGPGLQIAFGKTCVNQFLFAPVLRALSMGVVFYSKSRDFAEVKKKIRADFLEAQGASFLIKPLSNFIAFSVFPNDLVAQAVVLRVAGFGYNVYYSYMLNRSLDDDKPEKKEVKVEEVDDIAEVGSVPEVEENVIAQPSRRQHRTRLIRCQPHFARDFDGESSCSSSCGLSDISSDSTGSVDDISALVADLKYRRPYTPNDRTEVRGMSSFIKLPARGESLLFRY